MRIRATFLVIAEKVELDFISTGTGQIKVVEVLTVRRHYRLVGYAVCILPVGCLRCEESAEGLSVRLRRILPVGSNGILAIAETFLIGVAVLRDDGCDPLRVADGEAEACRRTVIKDVHAN